MLYKSCFLAFRQWAALAEGSQGANSIWRQSDCQPAGAPAGRGGQGAISIWRQSDPQHAPAASWAGWLWPGWLRAEGSLRVALGTAGPGQRTLALQFLDAQVP